MAERFVVEQRAFQFMPLPDEPLNIARTGLDLDWRRIERRSRRSLASYVRQTGDEILVSGFAWSRHFEDRSLFEELQLSCRRKARELRRAARDRGRRLRGSVILACTPEGRRAQAVLDHLDIRMNAWEKTSLCG